MFANKITPFYGIINSVLRDIVKCYLSVKNNMTVFVQLCGALLGMLAVLLGAFGSHRLKMVLSADQLGSFETGVRYQFYHALLLLILGFNLEFNSPLQHSMAWCFVLGTFLFSFSIYLLCLLSAQGRKIPMLGLVTPLGGLLLVSGWSLLFYYFAAR